MSTVLFGYFGAKSHQQSEFTAKEKNLLTLYENGYLGGLPSIY